MKIVRKGDGVYCATFRHRDGTLCVGFSTDRFEAASFCFEQVIERDKK